MKRSNKGFTLIELLIYTMIFAVSVGVFSGVLVTFTRVETQTSADSELTQQLAFVQSTIQQLVRASVNIENPAGVASSSLVLRMTSTTLDTTVISSDADGIYLKQGTGDVTPLTNSQVKVSQFQVVKYENPGAHAIVQVNISLTYNSQNPYQQLTRSLKIAIGRVTAATFDDNLVPNTDDSFSLGIASTNRWKDINISNLLNVGQLTTDPVAGAQNGSIYYNSASNAFRGYTNGAWSGLGGVGWAATSTNDIYNTNSGNVGIGTASPSYLLTVSSSTDSLFALVRAGAANPVIFKVGTDSALVINASSTDTLALKSGKVGIGTTSPGDTLEVIGSIIATGIQDTGKTTKMWLSGSVAATTLDYMEYSSDALAQAAYVTDATGGGTYGNTGGTITTDGLYKVHKFLLADTGTNFVAVKAGNIRALVVGGGGGTGSNVSGGGGAGGFRAIASQAVTAGNYLITVGAGGIKGLYTSDHPFGSNGATSTFGGLIVATGGGGGADAIGGNPAGDGGSGGGGRFGAHGLGNTPPTNPVQGYDGGHGGIVTYYAGGGGGGAGAVGTDGNGSTGLAGNGGNGLQSDILVSGSYVYYAGGGGGGAGGGNPGAIGGSGGLGGGAAGVANGGTPSAGTNGLGGGGGGGTWDVPPDYPGADGGSGVVIIRALTSDFLTAPSLQSYSEATIKTQGTYSLKGIAAITTSLNKTLTRTIASPINLTGKNTLNYDIRASRTGSNIKVGLHDAGSVDDSYSKLESHFDGANGATAYTDPVAGAYTFAGTAQLSTAQKEFGTASLLLDGNSDYVTVPASSDWDFGTGDFTIDAWIYPTVLAAWGMIVNMEDLSDNIPGYFTFEVPANGKPDFYIVQSSGLWKAAYSSVAVNLNEWSHVAGGVNGGVIWVSVNGVITTGEAISVACGKSDKVINIGAGKYSAGTWRYFTGYIDEVRISKGITRWTSNFTPPTREYGIWTDHTANILSADTFETQTWDISGVADADKNSIDKIIMTITNADAANTFYLDNMLAPSSGASSDIIFITSSSEIMRINSSGNVGIGTDSPTVKLEVNGNAKINSGGSANKVMCWKSDGATLGYCSDLATSTGGCTCN